MRGRSILTRQMFLFDDDGIDRHLHVSLIHNGKSVARVVGVEVDGDTVSQEEDRAHSRFWSVRILLRFVFFVGDFLRECRVGRLVCPGNEFRT
jgi:hypothetical protein